MGAKRAIFACALLVKASSDVSNARARFIVSGTTIAPADPVAIASARGRELRLALELAELEHDYFVSTLVEAGRALGNPGAYLGESVRPRNIGELPWKGTGSE